jgi:MinD-like ATPase involved in chromosome partitioning or flagellar assembly
LHRDVHNGNGLMQQQQTLLGLVSRTASWPQRLEAWSTSAAVPFTVSYCQSVAHLRARLEDGGAHQGVLLDGDLSFVDRDLLADIMDAGGVAVLIEGPRRRRPWDALGATAVLSADFDQRQLLDVLRGVLEPAAPARREHPLAPVVAVTGPGGTGASVSAIAVSQGLAAARRRVLLADCCLHAEQAMLHNAHGSQPDIVDIVELHAERTPERREMRQLAVGVVERGYYLLPGIARARHWSRIRGGSLEAALRSVRAAFDVVVADVDADVEGEAQGGSIEVEERNVLARTVLAGAAAVMVVGQPTMKGVYAMIRVLVELLEFGVAGGRVLPVINQAVADRTVRADLSRAVRHLLDGAASGGGVPGAAAVGPVLFAPPVSLEEHLRERDALDDAWPSLLAGAVTAVLDRAPTAPRSIGSPEPVAAGSLGHWGDGPGADDPTGTSR